MKQFYSILILISINFCEWHFVTKWFHDSNTRYEENLEDCYMRKVASVFPYEICTINKVVYSLSLQWLFPGSKYFYIFNKISGRINVPYHYYNSQDFQELKNAILTILIYKWTVWKWEGDYTRNNYSNNIDDIIQKDHWIPCVFMCAFVFKCVCLCVCCKTTFCYEVSMDICVVLILYVIVFIINFICFCLFTQQIFNIFTCYSKTCSYTMVWPKPILKFKN